MKVRKESILFWLPRIISIFFILFISLFATDVFNEYSFPDVIIALAMHLLPSILLLTFLVLSWKNDLIGGILYFIGWISFLLFFWERDHLSTQIIISSPLLVTSLMFFINYLFSRKKRT